MKRKILLPTDFSKNSINAINYATELYKNDECDFYLLNVFSATGNILESLLNMEPGSELYQNAKDRSETGLAKVYEMISMRDDYNSKHHFEVVSTFNNVVEAIKIEVEKRDIEMIIMGTKGETDHLDSTFGSTATYVMEKVRNCPVIVVPRKAKQTLPKEIVFPTSFKTHYKKRELNHLIDILKKCDAKLIVLHIETEDELSDEQKENKKLLKEILGAIEVKFQFLSNHSIESAVNIFVESRDSDMVAFINRKHAFFGSILTKPMVKSISFQSKVPILVMHDLRN